MPGDLGFKTQKTQIMQIMEKKRLQEVFSMVQGVSSNVDLIRWLGMMQSDMHSHMMVQLSAVELSM